MNLLRAVRHALAGMVWRFRRVRRPLLWFWLIPRHPVSRRFAFDRGTPIDRYYIARFLEANAKDIRGRVLEVGDNGYTLRFGGRAVTKSDVLHVKKGAPGATIIGNFATGKGLRADTYDCVILTQTLHVIYDIHSAVRNIHRVLKPGGVALLSIPCITQISRFDADRWGDYWRMTPAAAQAMLEEAFPARHLTLQVSGNLRLATAFLYGLAVEDIPAGDLAVVDPDYPLLACIRAEKPLSAGRKHA